MFRNPDRQLKCRESFSLKVLLLDTCNTALAVARALYRQGHIVHIARIGESSVADKSKTVKASYDLGFGYYDVGRYIKKLMALLSVGHYDFLIPVTDAALQICSAFRDDITRHTIIAMSSSGSAAKIYDKGETLRVAKSLGVPVPEYTTLSTFEEVENFCANADRYPYYLKPTHSAAIRKNIIERYSVIKVETPDDLRDCCREYILRVPIMAQQAVTGKGTGVYLLAKDGQILTAIQQNRLHEPINGGPGTYRVAQEIQPSLRSYTEQIMKVIGYTGAAMVEFKGNQTADQWWLMEINGRVWGSLPLTLRAGLDIPNWMLKLYGDHGNLQQLKTIKPKFNVYQRRLKADISWFIRTYFRNRYNLSFGLIYLAGLMRVLTGKEGYDFESFRDPLPGFYIWWQSVSLKLNSLQKRFRIRTIRRRYHDKIKDHEALLSNIKNRPLNILFLCKGNILRSAFAACYLKQAKGYLWCDSAGTLPIYDRISPRRMERIAKDTYNVNMSNHRSKFITPSLTTWADLILAMNVENLADLDALNIGCDTPAAILGDYAGIGEIGDPYHQSEEVMKRTLASIKKSVDRLFTIMQPEISRY